MAKTKCFRNDLVPNQEISLDQFAKERGTTPVSARKWLIENGITVQKIGNSRFVWSNDLLAHYNKAKDNDRPEKA